MIEFVPVESFYLYSKRMKSDTNEAMGLARSFIWNIEKFNTKVPGKRYPKEQMCDCLELMEFYLDNKTSEFTSLICNFLGRTVDRQKIYNCDISHSLFEEAPLR
jgi:hypothetical protein